VIVHGVAGRTPMMHLQVSPNRDAARPTSHQPIEP